MLLGPKAKLFSKSVRGRWIRWRAKKHAGVREAEGSNANIMRKGWEKEALRDLWTNWSIDNCWAQFVEAKKLCRACQLNCTGNMTLAMANIQLKPLLCLQWVFMSRKSFFLTLFVFWFHVFNHDGSFYVCLFTDQDVKNYNFGIIEWWTSCFFCSRWMAELDNKGRRYAGPRLGC